MDWVGLVRFKARLDQSSGQLATDWDSSQRMIWRHDITILIRHKEHGSPTLAPPRGLIWMGTCRKLHHDGFYMHQVPLVYMAMLRLASFESGFSVRSWVLCRLGRRGPFSIKERMHHKLNYDWISLFPLWALGKCHTDRYGIIKWGFLNCMLFYDRCTSY